ncbi:T9SS type A sorting domain-containing protein [Fluviicola sp.]|uniref:choice-of-anchor tandem repeat GloVer-containing protein n=1 Tax=Fluviicola sp. TaxID=1917219 RepID=UPI00260994B5|nr:T9SS type A sorting domain-containing protein [Fluviicola sp.]
MKKFLLFYTVCFLNCFAFSQKEIWGTVSNGGQYGHGYIFKTDSIGDNLQVVHHFDSVYGKNPGALLAASNNKLYGFTSAGGQNNQGLFSGGVFYEYDLTTATFKVLQHFGANNLQITGVYPAGDGLRGLTEVSPGVVYGQIRGAYQGGVVFAFNTTTETISTALNLPTFQGGTSNSTLGNRLEGNLYRAPDGFLYGTTYTNSQCPVPNPNLGSIIRIDPLTNAFSIRYLSPCNGSNGYQFENQFVSYNNILYSVAKPGGATNKGVIYAFDPATSTYTNKHNFQGGLLGQQPSPMMKATNGKFYGTANGGTPETGFPSGCGILFEFDPVTDQFTKKLDFTYGNGFYMNVGPFPFSLINGPNGKLYGVTGNGVFEYNPSSNQLVAKGRFPIDMGWYSPATPSLTAVCRKPGYLPVNDTSLITCEGTEFTFELESENTVSYVWKQNGAIDNSRTTEMLDFASLTVGDEGVWICEMTNECGTTISPSVTIDIVQNNPVVTQVGAELHASASAAYQWLNCDNGYVPINGETSQQFAPATNGNYAVITTSGTCSDTSDCYLIDDLGLNKEQPLDISILPNPAIDEISLLLNESIQIQSVKTMSAAGQLVDKGTSKVIKVNLLAPGIYSIIVETNQGNWTGKFLKIAP